MTGKGYSFTVRGRRLDVVLAERERQIRKWSRKVRLGEMNAAKRNNVNLVFGCAVFWRVGERDAHTLAFSLEQKVLIIDLEKVHVLPSSLLWILNKSEVYAYHVNTLLRKVKYLGPIGFPYLRHVEKRSATLARRVAQVKEGEISKDAVLVITKEAYGIITAAN